MTPLRVSVRDAGRWLLAYENQVFGLVITPIALRTWYNLYCRVEDYGVYFANQIYLVPVLSLLTILLSALYLSITSIILLTATKPVARYDTLLPNLLGVPAAFGVYAFSLISPSETRLVPVYVALLLLACGAGLVLTTLFHLRRAFSVTPQARSVVCSGPYQFVRHPMYLGNLLTMLGLALLLSTPLAFLIAGVNCLLQIVRGRYEDRLLSATFPEYGDYMKQVGAFFPRWTARKEVAATIALLGLATLYSPGSANAVAPSARLHPSGRHLVFVANDTPSQCKAWYAKALAGQWYTQDDVSAFFELDQSEPAVEKSQACRDFFKLQEKCQNIAVDMGDDSHDVMKILAVLESTPGCKAIIGADRVCRNLEAAGKGGKKLSSKLQAILPDCADQNILSNTGSFLRLGE
jgi:protein-S-isoprenylcysteine O-methyltransferase Ste14